MSGFDDSSGDMTFRQDSDARMDAAVESVIAGLQTGDDAVTALFADLRTLIGEPAPTPSPALAALFAGGAPALGVAPVVDLRDHAARRTRPFGRAAVTGGIVTAVLLGSVGAAAAHGGLPRQAQNAVADAVDALTPFTVPHAPAAVVSSRSTAPGPSFGQRPQRASRAVPVPDGVRPVAADSPVRTNRGLAVAVPGDRPEPGQTGSGHAAPDGTDGRHQGGRELAVRSDEAADGSAGQDTASRSDTAGQDSAQQDTAHQDTAHQNTARQDAARQEDVSSDGGNPAVRRSDPPPSADGTDSGGHSAAGNSGSSGDSGTSGSSASTPSSDGGRTAAAQPAGTDGAATSVGVPVPAPVDTQPALELSHGGDTVSGD